MHRLATFKTHALVLAGVAAIAAVGVGLWRTDLVLSRGFGKALQGAGPTLSFQPATGNGQTQVNVAGDEGYWLTRAEVESTTPFAKPPVLGDRITISGRDGVTRLLEITDLKTISTIPGKAGLRLMIVTCRAVGEGEQSGPVRFIVEAEHTEPRPTPAKTL